MIWFRYFWETYDFIVLSDNRIGRAIVFFSLGTFMLQGLIVRAGGDQNASDNQ